MPHVARLNGGTSISWASRCSSDPLSGAVRGRAAGVWAAIEELIVTDARISFRIDQVRHEVHEEEYQGHEQDAPLDGGEIPLLDRAQHVAAEAGPSKDRLGEDAAGEVAPGVESDHGDDRDQRVAEAVPQDHRRLAQPLGASGADEVARQHIQHGRRYRTAGANATPARTTGSGAVPPSTPGMRRQGTTPAWRRGRRRLPAGSPRARRA